MISPFDRSGRVGCWHGFCCCNGVMKKKKKKQPVNMDDVIKAMRRGNREGEQEVLGPGFHATNRVHRSKKTYTRKLKHKGCEE